MAYHPHNIHFLWDSATTEGRSRTAIEAARKAASKIPEAAWREVPLLHQFLIAPLFAYTRFGEWDLILNEPRPAPDSLFWTGVWHYARGLAFTAKGNLDEANGELNSLGKISAVEKKFIKAWQGADVSLTASRFMGDTQTTLAAAESAVSGN